MKYIIAFIVLQYNFIEYRYIFIVIQLLLAGAADGAFAAFFGCFLAFFVVVFSMSLKYF